MSFLEYEEVIHVNVYSQCFDALNILFTMEFWDYSQIKSLILFMLYSSVDWTIMLH